MDIAIMVNPYKRLDSSFVEQLVRQVKSKGGSASVVDLSTVVSDFRAFDAAVCLGGDGTVLGVARFFEKTQTPIFAANFGHRGFLTNLEGDDGEVCAAVAAILAGEYRVELRSRVHASIVRAGAVDNECSALNEVVIKGGAAKVIRAKLYIDEHFAGNFVGDGIIIATPTGSTAYSMSAGGPVVAPNAGVLLVTPVSANCVMMRPVVVGDNQQIRLLINEAQGCMQLTADGQVEYTLQPGDEVVIKKADYSTRLLRVEQVGFYDVLSRKIRCASQYAF